MIDTRTSYGQFSPTATGSIRAYHSLVIYQNGENSHYNSLQVELRSHLRMGLDLHAAYTYSKSVDPTAANGGGDLDVISNPYAGWQFDQGPSPFDRTHVAFFTLRYNPA